MSECILLVDDEQNILNSLERLFLDAPFRVLTASSASEAMKLVQKNSISVIISDNIMPGINGINFLSWAKTASPDSVRLLMTGYADMQTAIDAINRGEVYRFITKPWDPVELENIVHDSFAKYRIIVALRTADESKLLSLAQTIELKDPYTKGHCERVAMYSTIIAEAVGIKGEMKKNIRDGSWLHDCGKIGVPEAVLNKPGKLSPEQFEIVKKHSNWGAEVTRKAMLHETVINIALHHHEKYDGKGYPHGLAGDKIPIEARIVAIADAYDAMTSDRPYRTKLSPERAFDYLRSEKDISFDPALVDVFISAFTDRHKEGKHGK
jgi:putative nucleotidyltransferase with HDIG domain